MAKFCNKCGKELVDGKCPDCDKEEKVEVKEEPKAEVKEEVKAEVKSEATKTEAKSESTSNETSEIAKKLEEGFKTFLTVAKGMVKNPAKTLEENNKSDLWIFALIVILVNSILFGFVVKVIIDQTVGDVMSILSTTLKTEIAGYSATDIAQITGIFGNGATDKVQKFLDISYWTRVSGFGFAINSLIIIAIIWLMHGILFGKKTNLFNIISMVGNCQSILLFELLIEIVLSYVSPIIAVILLPIFLIAFIVNIHFGINVISKASENQNVYMVAFSSLCPAACTTIVTFVLIMAVAMAKYFATLGASAITSLF